MFWNAKLLPEISGSLFRWGCMMRLVIRSSVTKNSYIDATYDEWKQKKTKELDILFHQRPWSRSSDRKGDRLPKKSVTFLSLFGSEVGLEMTWNPCKYVLGVTWFEHAVSASLRSGESRPPPEAFAPLRPERIFDYHKLVEILISVIPRGNELHFWKFRT